MPAIADQWTCMNIRCRNKGRTCWQQKKPNGPDLAENHYPVSGEIFQKWSKEIAKEISCQPRCRTMHKNAERCRGTKDNMGESVYERLDSDCLLYDGVKPRTYRLKNYRIE